MLKKFFLLMIVSFATMTANAAYYSKLIVESADETQGLVAVSNENKKPSSFASNSELTQSTSGILIAFHTYYAFAQPQKGYLFDYWADSNGKQLSTDETFRHTITTSNTSANSPKTETIYAHFKIAPPVLISSSYDKLGTVAFKNEANNEIGKSITVVASYYKPTSWTTGDFTNVKSKSVKFVGWFIKGTDTLMSEAMSYTFNITEPVELEARFEYKQAITASDGYYRVKCSFNSYSTNLVFPIGSEKYLSIKGEKKWGISSGRDVTRDIHYSNNMYSDPSCILRITGKNFDELDEKNYKSQQTILSSVDLAGQGSSTFTATGTYFTIKSTEQPGLYKLTYSSYALYNGYEGVNAPMGELTISRDYSNGSEAMRSFDFLPISEEYIDEFYFAAEPDVTMLEDGCYWTSMYTGFPYKCWEYDGVEAYYISALKPTANETVAVLTLIEDGVVPAFTPVLLKCKDTHPSGNRLLPLLEGPTSSVDSPFYKDNLLRGEFQLNQFDEDKDENKVKFDGNSMRVFSSSNGVVGFYKLADGTELAANKAWLDISSLTPAQASRIVLRPNDTTGIDDVVVEEDNNVNATIYNLMGQPVKELVPGQIYFRNGKKFIAR